MLGVFTTLHLVFENVSFVFLLLYICVCDICAQVWTGTCQTFVVEVGGQLLGVSFLLPLGI